jgi:hypothetical protein
MPRPAMTCRNRFSSSNIRTGAPMAMLEEVLEPMYFSHRSANIRE